MPDELRPSNPLTDDELTYQLVQLETNLELRIADLPASQIIRTATRRIELKNREIERLERENVRLWRALDWIRWDDVAGTQSLRKAARDVLEGTAVEPQATHPLERNGIRHDSWCRSWSHLVPNVLPPSCNCTAQNG